MAARITAARVLLAPMAAAVLHAGAAFGQEDPQSLSGARLFTRYCAACHGPEGRGDGPVAPALNVALPDLTRLAERHDGQFPAADVAATIDGRALAISHGTHQMPVWGYRFWMDAGADRRAQDRMHEMIERLVAHVESLQTVAER